MVELAPSKKPSGLRRMMSESVVYGLGGIANQALSIVLVPIYARELGATDYGILAVLLTTLSLTTMIVGLAMQQAFFRSYLKDARTDPERRRVMESVLALRLLVSTVGLGAFALAAPVLTLFLFGATDQLPIVLLIGVTAFFDSLNLIPLSYLRGERRPLAYSLLAFTRVVLGGALIIAFVVGMEMGIGGALLGSALSALVTTTTGYAILGAGDRLKLRWDRHFSAYVLRFCLPLVPAAVAGWTLSLSDRYIIGAFDGFEAVGVYSVGYTIGLAMNALVIQPFGLAWGAAYWEYAQEDDAHRIVARAMTLFVVVAAIPAVGLSLFGTDVTRLLFGPDFEAGRFVIPFAAFGYLAYGVYAVAGTGLNLANQTRWLPVTVGAAAAANLAMNLVTVPLLGFMGAAYSTLVSYTLLAVLTGLVAHRYYPVQWDYPRIAGTAALGLGLTGAGLLGPDALPWRLLCFLALPASLVLTGIVSKQDTRRLLEWTSSLSRRLGGGRSPQA